MAATLPQALAPTFLLILLGFGLRQRRFVADAFWPSAEKLTYYVLFPCLLTSSLAAANLDLATVLPMAGALVGGVIATATALLGARSLLHTDGPAFSSVFQGVIRPNTYVGLAAAQGLFGTPGVTLAAIGIAAVVPLVNVLSVAILVRYGARAPGAATGWRATLIAIGTNPLILAVALGLVLNVSGLGLPPVVAPVAEALGRASLPIGLLAVGAGLDLRAIGRAGRLVGIGAAVKLLATPGLTLLFCLVLGVGGLQAAVAVLYNALPTSASAYVLARQMGGDATVMAGIITVSTIAAAATIPILMLIVA